MSVCVCVCLSVCLLDTDERGSTRTCWSYYPRRHLRSANRHLLAVPRFPLNTYGRRTFSVAGPMAWNSLPDFIHDPTSSTDCFRRLLKRTCSRDTSASSALAVLNDYAPYKSTHSVTSTRVMYLGHVLAKHTNIMTHSIHCVSKSPLVNFWNNSVKN